MNYLKPTFTLPASNPHTTQKNWDRAFMTPIAFHAKYYSGEYMPGVGWVTNNTGATPYVRQSPPRAAVKPKKEKKVGTQYPGKKATA